jgi:hypothetical protein
MRRFAARPRAAPRSSAGGVSRRRAAPRSPAGGASARCDGRYAREKQHSRNARPLLVHCNGERAIDRAEVERRFRRKQERASFANASCRACGSSEARAQASGIAERGLRWSFGSIRWLRNGTAR